MTGWTDELRAICRERTAFMGEPPCEELDGYPPALPCDRCVGYEEARRQAAEIARRGGEGPHVSSTWAAACNNASLEIATMLPEEG